MKKLILFFILLNIIIIQANENIIKKYEPTLKKILVSYGTNYSENELKIKVSDGSRFIEEYYPFIKEFAVSFKTEKTCSGTIRIDTKTGKLVGFSGIGFSVNKDKLKKLTIDNAYLESIHFIELLNNKINLEDNYVLFKKEKIDSEYFSFTWKRKLKEYIYFWDRLIVSLYDNGMLSFYTNENFLDSCPLNKKINISKAVESANKQLTKIFEKNYKVIKLSRVWFWKRTKEFNGLYIFNINDFPILGCRRFTLSCQPFYPSAGYNIFRQV